MQQQSQNEENGLDDIFLAFAQTLLAQMEVWAARQGIPVNLHRRVFFAEHTYTESFEMRKEYRWLINSHTSDPLWASKEAYQYAQRFFEEVIQPSPRASTSLLSAETLTPDQIWSLLVHELVRPIVEVLQQDETLQPTQERLLDSFHHFREDVAVKTVPWMVTIPLISFTSNLQQEESLSPLFSLSPFAPEEKTQTWNAHTSLEMPPVMPIPLNFGDFHRAHFKLRGFYQQPPKTYGNEEVAAELNTLLTSLRLVNAGDIGAPVHFHTSQNMCTRPYMTVGQPARRFAGEYTLAQADLSMVKALYDALQRLGTQRSGLTVALRRFNQAYGRELLEDRIIDLTIALESCLLTEKEELNYRLSLRGAALLALERAWPPSEAQALLKAMYAIRSAIVHTGQELSNPQGDVKKALQRLGLDPHQFSQQCENIVRSILRAFVTRSSQSMGSVIQQLDSGIILSLAKLSENDTSTTPSVSE